MAMRVETKKRLVRRAKRTVLLVGEGDDEVAFLKHVKSIYILRESGTAVTIKNAYGGGAENVIKVAVKQSANADYDLVAALFDTDAGWTDAAKNEARRKRIVTLKSDPCFEAMLLRAVAKTTQSRGNTLKDEFKVFLGGSSRDSSSYAKKFPRETLEQAAKREQTLQQLINLLPNAPSS
jgi:RloB-like protein